MSIFYSPIKTRSDLTLDQLKREVDTLFTNLRQRNVDIGYYKDHISGKSLCDSSEAYELLKKQQQVRFILGNEYVPYILMINLTRSGWEPPKYAYEYSIAISTGVQGNSPIPDAILQGIHPDLANYINSLYGQ